MKHYIDGISIYKLLALLLVCMVSPALGIVFHPDGEPDLGTWTDRPDSNAVGRWGSNASCVPISPNHIITTKHQGGGVSTLVVIGGVAYSIDQIWTHATNDFRIAKLHSANLNTYSEIYDPNVSGNEYEKAVVIGGFGKRREPFDTINPYAWTTETNNINNPLLFGTNEIEDVSAGLLVARFNSSSASLYECTIASFDSGGGWFIKDGSKWKVAGLSRGVSPIGDFSNYIYPDDYVDSVRVSTYANSAWFEVLPITICSGPVAGDFNGDCVVDREDLEEFLSFWLDDDCGAINNYCQGSDFEPDGDVDLVDYASFLENWMQDYSAQ